MATLSIQNVAYLTYAGVQDLSNESPVQGKPFMPNAAEQAFTVVRDSNGLYTIAMGNFRVISPAVPADNVNVGLSDQPQPEDIQWVLQPVGAPNTFLISRANQAGLPFYWTLNDNQVDTEILLQELRGGAQATTQHWVII